MEVVLLQENEKETDTGMFGGEVGRCDVLLSTEIDRVSMDDCLRGKDW